MFIKKILNFVKLDFRWKLITIQKILGVKFLYPDFFSTKGIKGFYTRIIVNLIYLKKTEEAKKLLYKKIKNNNTNEKVNFLISAPSSGSTFLRHMLRSYFEMLYKIGDGIPKYDNVNNEYIFASSQILTAELWGMVDFKRAAFMDFEPVIDSEEFHKKKIVMSRYPLTRLDLYKENQIRPVILTRDPIDEVSSQYIRYDKRDNDSKRKTINEKVLNLKISQYEKYITFWGNFIKDKKFGEDFLVVDYKNLVNDTENIFNNVLKFYNYEINLEYIKQSAYIHTKENTMKLFNKIKIYNITRFQDVDFKKSQISLISEYFNKKILNTEIISSYNKLNGYK